MALVLNGRLSFLNLKEIIYYSQPYRYMHVKSILFRDSLKSSLATNYQCSAVQWQHVHQQNYTYKRHTCGAVPQRSKSTGARNIRNKFLHPEINSIKQISFSSSGHGQEGNTTRPKNEDLLSPQSQIVAEKVSEMEMDQSDKSKQASPPPQLQLSSEMLLDLLNIKRTAKITKYNPDEWITVYRLPQIKYAYYIQKLKILQTGFTTFASIPAMGLHLFGLIPEETLIIVLGASSLACVMLYVMGSFASKLIGFVYVSKEDPMVVRVAHMNFWGTRVDKLFKKTDFVPFSDLTDSTNDIYTNLKFYSDPEMILHICLRHGNIEDEYEFEEIFGMHAKVVSEKTNKK